jgi:hypothetical protein
MEASPTLRRCLCSLVALVAGAPSTLGQINVTTYHNNTQRTGLNSSETILTPANVASNKFGMMFTLPVDGNVYAQPLYLANIAIPNKGIHNVLYVVTEHNSVYAFDAGGITGVNSTPLWHVNLGPSVPSGDVYLDGAPQDIFPEIGITATPVIQLPTGSQTTGTLYVVAKTKTIVNNNPVYTQSLHALDVTTGKEKFGGPVVIQGKVSGKGDGTDGTGHVPFNPLIQNCRAGLLFLPAVGSIPARVVFGFASHGDIGAYHGWLFSYNADTLQQMAVLNLSPNAVSAANDQFPKAGAAIWQGGGGIASDGSWIYFATGNGTFDPTTAAYGDCVVKVDGQKLQVADYFCPDNQNDLNYTDGDEGASGPMLLPSNVATQSIPDILIQSSKRGVIDLINEKNLGKYNASMDNVLQELPDSIGDIWGNPAYWNGHIYYGAAYGSPIQSIPISAGAIAPPNLTTTFTYNYPGPTPAVSSNGNSNAILWAIQSDNWQSSGPAYLQAYNASTLGAPLYNSSNTNGRDNLGAAIKWTTPTIANGRVYVGTGSEVDVFGLQTFAAQPSLGTPSGTYSNSVSTTLSDSTPGAIITYTTNGTVPTVNSALYKGTLTFTTSTTLTARAFLNGVGGSPVVVGNYLINPAIGNGLGLAGWYYANTQTPNGTSYTAARIDPTINFNWNGNSPISGVGATNWAAEWNGTIEAETTGTYTFYTVADDGVTLSVNGQLLINDFVAQAPTQEQATIQLVAGHTYPIQIQYFQASGGSLLQLFWSAPGIGMQIVPQTQLNPNK